jgi:hypothetical protein
MRTSAAILAVCILVPALASGCSKDAGADKGDQAAAGAAGDNATAGAQANTPSGAGGAIATAGANSAAPRAGSAAPARMGASGAGGVGPDVTPPSAAGTGGAPAAGTGGTPPPAIAECPKADASMDTGPTRTVSVDAAAVVGRIRSLQGAHWDPGSASGALSKNYVSMGVDMIRTHDAGGINGSGAGDIDGPGRSRIFPSWNADPEDPASYNFGPTDTLLKNITDTKAEVYFRVGRSNISGGNTVPPDFDKYGEVVKHVVMHYNQGWANGFKYGIRYFEIWNEPDFVPFWTGTGEQYHELYGKIARGIKAADPNALIGGPANSTFNDMMKTRGSLMQYIKDNQLPLDFYSFHKYTNKSNDPYDFARMAQSFREELDKYGFTKAEIVNSEFESSLQGDPILGGQAGRAVFMAEALMYMQDAPIAKSHSYMQIGSSPTKESLAFGAVSKLNATPARLCVQGANDSGFAVLAGRAEEGQTLQVLLANYQIPKSLQGPIPGGNDEMITVPGLGYLATMTYPERRSFTYTDKEGYALTIKSIPEAWGDVTLKQYRIDANNDFKLINTTMSKAADRAQGSLSIAGAAWAHARPGADDPNPKGAEQGLDLLVVTGAGSTVATL